MLCVPWCYRVIRYLDDMVHQEWSSSPVHTDICFLCLPSYQFLSFWLHKYTVSISHKEDQKDDHHKSKRRMTVMALENIEGRVRTVMALGNIERRVRTLVVVRIGRVIAIRKRTVNCLDPGTLGLISRMKTTVHVVKAMMYRVIRYLDDLFLQEWSSSPMHTDICFLWLPSYQFSFWFYKCPVSISHQEDQKDEKDDGHNRKRRDDSDCARKHRENSQNRDGSQDRESESHQEKVSKLFGPWDIGIDFKNKNYCPCCVCQRVVWVIRYLDDLVHQQGSSSPLQTDICFLWLTSYQFLSFWLHKYTVSISHQEDQKDEKDDGHRRKRRDDSDCAWKHRGKSQNRDGAQKHREKSQNRDGSQDRERDNDHEKVSKLFGPWDIGIDFKNANYCACCEGHDVIE